MCGCSEPRPRVLCSRAMFPGFAMRMSGKNPNPPPPPPQPTKKSSYERRVLAPPPPPNNLQLILRWWATAGAVRHRAAINCALAEIARRANFRLIIACDHSGNHRGHRGFLLLHSLWMEDRYVSAFTNFRMGEVW